MSGTSLDGVDLARIYLEFVDHQWRYSIEEAETIAYSDVWINRLKNGINLSTKALKQLNDEYTVLLADYITTFLEKHKIKELDAVCSHGHTILHQPQKGITVQIGNLSAIADLVKQTVVCDFRVQDVLLGGQGAPLVPIGDRLLFNEYSYCLNLGGFSNVSFEENKQRIAFDISPVNTVLNQYANQLGLAYDDKGYVAAKGNCNSALLDQLNAIPFYHQSYPKSLGFEFVKETVFPLIEAFSISIEDKMNTFVEHVAVQIANALPQKKGKMLVTGGGAYNDYLIQRMQYHLPEMQLIIPDAKTLEYKEALIFGLLGVLRLRNENNVLSSVTGASKDHCSGRIITFYTTESNNLWSN